MRRDLKSFSQSESKSRINSHYDFENGTYITQNVDDC